MNALLRAWAILTIALKRIYAQKWLSVSILFGLAVSIALTMTVPIYADGVYYRVLTGELARISERSGRPPFAFIFQYLRPHQAPSDWEDVQPVDSYLVESAARNLGLPQQSLVRYFSTHDFRIFPESEVQYADVSSPLFWASFAYATEIVDHITIVEGGVPGDAIPTQDSTIEVLIHENLASDLGLQVGESYIAYDQQRTGDGIKTTQIPLSIAGIWRPTNPADGYWFYDPRALKEIMLVTEGTFHDRLSPYLQNEVNSAVWYLVLDGSRLDTSDVNPLLARINRVQYQVTTLLPNTLVPDDAQQALLNYRQDTIQLTLLLYIFSIPIISLMLAFISLVVGLSVARQQNVIAVLRSRGGTALQMIGMAALEALILGLLAFALAIPLSLGLASLVGQSRSFLDFSLETDMRLRLSPVAIQAGLLAVGLAVLAQVLPTIGASLHTIVTYKRERARALRPPWWQRIWLDILLLLPVVYGIYLIQQQGSIISPLAEGSDRPDPLQNPLLLLIPFLGIFALTLLMLRVLPYAMSLLSRLTFRTNSLGVLMASRHLARSPGFYSAPLILLVLTLGLSTFIASLAQTLDHHLYNQQFYAYGAEMNLLEIGESANESSVAQRFAAFAGPNADQDSESDEEAFGPRFFFLPVAEHLEIAGVERATRVGNFQAFMNLTGTRQEGLFIGVDRADFLHVTFWRDDFAPLSLGELMNRLALNPNGVLVDQEFMTGNGLRIGDTFRVEVQMVDQRVEMDVKIVGMVQNFPTWYPQNEEGDSLSLLVGNLEHLYEQAGATYPYSVWLRVRPDADYESIIADANSRGLGVVRWDAPLLEVSRDQRQPERQGLFGVLSVGFLAAIFLTVLGFLLYSLFSFRRRFIELGVLRAIGLSSLQMTRFLAWELIFLIFGGTIVGTGLGIAVSDLFIPYLQVGEGLLAQYPPFVVEISWAPIVRIFLLFGLLFLSALWVLIFLLMRMRVFEAIKLGETT